MAFWETTISQPSFDTSPILSPLISKEVNKKKWRDMASASNQYTLTFHSGGSSQVGPQMMLRVLKKPQQLEWHSDKLMVVHSIADFNGEGQPTLSNQD